MLYAKISLKILQLMNNYSCEKRKGEELCCAMPLINFKQNMRNNCFIKNHNFSACLLFTHFVRVICLSFFKRINYPEALHFLQMIAFRLQPAANKKGLPLSF